ncbi:MAG: hemerythrin domain-containing protein [Candidatus Omnitrophota bacterium]|nr:hemerythrin domain-containing protein [Candidatus Omnitrophota bacterium]
MMNAGEGVQRDHEILRATLDAAEAALAQGREAWSALREACATLLKRLEGHVQREAEVVASCREQLRAAGVDAARLEHDDEYRYLRAINRLFMAEPECAFAGIQPALAVLVANLRRRMEEQETILFPLMKRHPGAAARSAPLELTPTMTVNRVLRQYPSTHATLERLVDLSYEAYDPLDEVAWRHGMDCEALLAMLGQAICSNDR